MAGLPKNYDTTTVTLGPGDVWVNLQLPTTGNRPTITAAADGSLTPDATLSASAVHLGMTLEGSKMMIKAEPELYFSDEQAAPIIATVTAVEASIEGTMIQTLDTLILAKLMLTGTRTAGSGYEQLTIGDGQALTTYTCLVIAPTYNDTTKVVALELYKTFNEAGFEMDIGRKKMAASPFKFRGMSIASRPQADRIGIFWKTIT